MFRRSTLCAVAFTAMVIATGTYAAADVHDGIVVSVAAGKLVMADGVREHNYDVGLTAKITLDGKKARLAELKTGDMVRVAQDNEGKVVAVVAVRKPAFHPSAPSPLDSHQSYWYPTDHFAAMTGKG